MECVCLKIWEIPRHGSHDNFELSMLFIHFLIVSHLLLKRWVVLLLNDHQSIVVVIRIVRSQGCCQSNVFSSIPSWPQGSLILWLGQASLAPHTGLGAQWTSEACFDAGQRITFHWARIDTCHSTACQPWAKIKQLIEKLPGWTRYQVRITVIITPSHAQWCERGLSAVMIITLHHGKPRGTRQISISGG